MRPIRNLLLLTLVSSTSLLAEEPAAPKAPEAAPPKPEAKSKTVAPVVRRADVTIDGRKIPYEVIAGKLRITMDKEAADIFHVTYRRNDPIDPKRPVMFAFNGGPGSSAVWLHVGMLGPKIVDLPGDGTSAPKPPVLLKNNPYSILDVCDLVFIDPVSTGYSRAADGKKPDAFHGVNGDIEAVAEFIQRWITENNRWASPKYLLGESYGGIRAAGVADSLQSRHGMPLNGVVLLSSLLDYGTLGGDSGHDLEYLVFLPTYTSVAHHHGRLKGDRDALVEASRRFAMGPYAQALMEGTALTDDVERCKAIAAQLETHTAIPAAVWIKNHLRVDSSLFRAELLRDQSKTLGRFDGRVAWGADDSSSTYPQYDPSYSLAFGAFSTALKDYLGREIGYKEDEAYEVMTSKVHPWKWDSQNSMVNLADRLAEAMRDNPHLKVLVMTGHADLATPGDAIAHSLSHLHNLPAELRKNIRTVQYEAGHMFYLNPPDLAKSRKDLLDWLK
ncbi:MAG TPA: hypothetical protein VFY13_00575 [Luteolibacter sp.]|nr:hypothetical protein [Luteolibacter sp.]